MAGENKRHLLISTRRVLIIACIVVFGMALVASAKVFFRSDVSARMARSLESRGGSRIYQSTVRINGGKANLIIFNFEKSISRLMDDLKPVFGKDLSFGNGMGMATVKDGGNVTRLVAIKLDSVSKTILFQIDQTEEEFAASSKPAPQAVRDVPSFPGSTQGFFASDDSTSTSLSLSTTSAGTAEIMAFYDSSLKASGWKVLPPTGTSAGFVIYGKGDAICCVMANLADAGAESRITLLHKQRRIE
ncbi:MAG: hypothetical protein C0404_07610 [Verrucomicrobia bacterium]|nr:hypothetical protein [Verrucomicrobiota bacterium]